MDEKSAFVPGRFFILHYQIGPIRLPQIYTVKIYEMTSIVEESETVTMNEYLP
jgi:hypothetical protein